jgi:hypothetical protein
MRFQGGGIMRVGVRGLVLSVLVAALAATSAYAAVSVFATGMIVPESITQTASGSFYVTDADDSGPIWSIPAGGGSATRLAKARYSLRDAIFLPAGFGSVGGQFLVVGGQAVVNGTAFASTMDASFKVRPYASQARSLWNTPVFATSFGQFSGDVLVTNQGSGTESRDGSVDVFTPSGTVGRLTTLPSVNVPFGAALAPGSFGDVGGRLLVSDAGGSGIYSVSSSGAVSLFTTIPLASGQSGLRQMAFAPKGWGPYSGDLFVSVNTRDIDVVNNGGVVVGRISGSFNPRGLRFTTLSGSPTLLFSDTSTGFVRRASPGDVVHVGD